MKAGSREKLFDMLLYQSLSQGVNNPKPGTDAYVDWQNIITAKHKCRQNKMCITAT